MKVGHQATSEVKGAPGLARRAAGRVATDLVPTALAYPSGGHPSPLFSIPVPRITARRSVMEISNGGRRLGAVHRPGKPGRSDSAVVATIPEVNVDTSPSDSEIDIPSCRPPRAPHRPRGVM